MDGQLNIATGASAHTKIWKNKTISWSELALKLRTERKTDETHKEFISMPKTERLAIKDVGGYVGGYLRNGRRKPENVVHRQLLTLDVDFAHRDFWDDFTLFYGEAALIHATHTHCEASPRYRLILPLSREVTPDEYVAIGRHLAGVLGIDLFDNTTFETNRLMFWPSNPSDVDYYCEYQDGEWLDADKVLASYADWTDSSLWPTAEAKLEEIRSAAQKQEDPQLKKGVVGAFCRAYTITEAIEKYLPDVYTSAGEDRYTYAKGTAAAGLVVYNDTFAYSHHGTDPCGGKLCNAFDLVRLHLHGYLDEDQKQGAKPKSFSAMNDTAREDDKVKGIIAKETFQEANYDFQEDFQEAEAVEAEDLNWMTDLETDQRGKYTSTAANISLILANDHRLKKVFRLNKFDNRVYVFRTLPWRKVDKPEPRQNVDLAGVRNYIETIYGIVGKQKIEDASDLDVEKNGYHPVKDYLRSVSWDGTKRIDTLLTTYFGADDNLYTREASRKMLCGAVARIMNPGCKFDLVLTLIGHQGAQKSSFCNILGRSWFSDTFLSVQGKDALEQIQGTWIMEMAELSGLKKADIETVKHFISKQEDVFRPAYARTAETYKRQVIFIATTNERNFLRDPSGNRRFLPIDCFPEKATKRPLDDLEAEVDQIWAEAVLAYRAGEKLYLTGEAERMSLTEQKMHSETDERIGLIEQYLDTPITEDWEDKDIYSRRSYYTDELAAKGNIMRENICVAEVWCECLCKEREDMDRYKTREINDILKSLSGWGQSRSTKNFKHYGKQKFYYRLGL